MMKSRRSIIAVALVFALAVPLIAQQAGQDPQEATIRRVVDRYMNRLLARNTDGPRRPGAIVGISLRGKRYFFPY
jgi:hypothetical protein